MPSRRKHVPFPSDDEILDFIRESPRRPALREIARAFHLSGPDHAALRDALGRLESRGLLEPGRRGKRGELRKVPPVSVVEVTGLDEDGAPLARLTSWDDDTPPPVIRIGESRRRGLAPGRGDRVLARLHRLADGTYEAQPMRRIERAPSTFVGAFTLHAGVARIEPTDRRIRDEFEVLSHDTGGALPGELVRAEALPGDRYGRRHARVIERLGDANAPGFASHIAIHSRGIPVEFPAAALQEAQSVRSAPHRNRDDLRDLPLVTVDDADARDFDDAVWAEPDPEVSGGWHIVVAIADVAWYVRPGDALDDAARNRGNSVYFPDRVVPMLPERLSNDLCSLRPNENRPCLAVHLWIDAQGEKLRHRFVRATMRSAARLTYGEVQAAFDGHFPSDLDPALRPRLKALHGAYEALERARVRRGTLDLELPERRVLMGEDGTITGVEKRPRYDSHRMIEEFMILANVAAAEAVTGRQGIYRVHDRPSMAKLEAVAPVLRQLGISLPRRAALDGGAFNEIVGKAAKSTNSELVSLLVLRCQARAEYSASNHGHFGLALTSYTHFTSPIRRYADLIVHRALIAALKLGDGGEAVDDRVLEDVADHITMTERRAADAERDALDRLSAVYLAEHGDATFEGRISTIMRAGMFVTLSGIGVDGFIPGSFFGGVRLDDRRQEASFPGRRRPLRIGDTLRVTVEETNPLTGSIVFRPLNGHGQRAGKKSRERKGSKSRAGRRRSKSRPNSQAV